MQERLELVRLSPRAVLDAGCGEGDDLVALQRRYPDAQQIGADISAQMLAVAGRRYRAEVPTLRRWLRRLMGKPDVAQWHCEDFAQLSLPDASVDLLWSNLALHWHPQPQQVFGEWLRTLRVDGLLMFSCFGPDTLRELRRAFAQADAALHALPFIDMHDLGDMLQRTGFATPVMEMETITVTYESPQQLIDDVRAFGGNPLANRRRGLMSRAQGARVMAALDAQRGSDGRIPLTFEVLYGHAFKPAPKAAQSGENVVRFVPRR